MNTDRANAAVATPPTRKGAVSAASSSRPEAGRNRDGRARNPADRLFDKLISFFASLRLTVVCLGLGLVLVFIGTLAQVDLGLYKAQNEFFRSFFIYWTPRSGWRIPVFPGGY